MVKPLELKGKTFGKLFVIDRAGSDKKGKSLWLTKCIVKNCGKEIVVLGYRLTSKTEPMTHCGCLTSKHRSDAQLDIDKLIGQKIGNLTILGFIGVGKHGAIMLVKCVCGKNIKVFRERLTNISQPMTHCGCLTNQNRGNPHKGCLSNLYIHGQSYERSYKNEQSQLYRLKVKNQSSDIQNYSGFYKTAREKHNFCVYCGISELSDRLSVDHIFPVSKGGTNDPTNLITACRGCNSSKGKKLFIDWYHSYMGDLNTLEEILDYMGFDSLEHLTNYQNILVHAYQQKKLSKIC